MGQVSKFLTVSFICTVITVSNVATGIPIPVQVLLSFQKKLSFQKSSGVWVEIGGRGECNRNVVGRWRRRLTAEYWELELVP